MDLMIKKVIGNVFYLVEMYFILWIVLTLTFGIKINLSFGGHFNISIDFYDENLIPIFFKTILV